MNLDLFDVRNSMVLVILMGLLILFRLVVVLLF